jgi:FkbM family methyltransferase
VLRERLSALRARALAPVTDEVRRGAGEFRRGADALARIEERLARLEERFDGLEHRMAELGAGQWTARAVGLGDRVLVGCRHLNLSYLMRADDLLLLPQFLADGDYERATTEYLKRTVPVDGVAVDVGANFGYYTCLLARLAWQGKVLAFEPDPEVFELLRDNIAANWCGGVAAPTNAAVGDRSGTLTLHRRVERTGNTSIAPPDERELERSGRATEVFDVRCTTLDEVTAPLDRVDVVKVDVEGAEPLVLAGMEQLVRRHRPDVVMEWSPEQTVAAGFDPDELVGRIAGLGLRPHRILPGGRLEELGTARLAELEYQNLVLRP